MYGKRKKQENRNHHHSPSATLCPPALRDPLSENHTPPYSGLDLDLKYRPLSVNPVPPVLLISALLSPPHQPALTAH